MRRLAELSAWLGAWLAGHGSHGAPAEPPPYKLHCVLGVGSFGKVYLATQTGTRRVVALKACSRAHVVARATVDRMRAEVAVLKMQQSPFICAVVTSFKTATKVCVVLEFAQGGELYRLFRLKNGRLDLASVRFYAAHIILALEHLHGLHVAFRDLKLENVLITAQGNVKLCDLGLCKCDVVECDRGASTVVGTMDYLAPEVLAAGAQYGWAVDWWAVGTLAHELLTGRTVFAPAGHSTADEKDIERKILNDPVVVSAKLEPAVRATLERLLDKNPRTRLGSAEGAAEIQRSPMFAEFDWAACAALALPAPWVPALSSPLDVAHFDDSFTSLPLSYAHPRPMAGHTDCGPDDIWGDDFPDLANATMI